VLAATNPKVAYSLVKEGKAVMIDVREQTEIKEGMIDKAIWFPKSKMTSDKNWKQDFQKLTAGKKIFLHCRSGRRSGEVKEILKQEGIEAENIGGYEQLKTILPTVTPKG
jgi:adenylyltransferase/sulfurtransferase